MKTLLPLLALLVSQSFTGPTHGAEAEAPAAFELHRIFNMEGPDRVAVESPYGAHPLYMEKAPLMDATSLESATATPGRRGWEIIVTLTKPGGKLFLAITSKNVGEQIGILCDGKLL